MLSSLDWKLFLPAVLLASIGSLVLSSVSPASYPSQYFFIALALISYLIFAKIDFTVYKTLAPLFYVLSLVLLLLTLAFGTFTRGAVRWIEIGNFTLQTSEIIKPFVVLFVAWILSTSLESRKIFLLAAVAGFLPFILVFIQPDLGSSLVVLAGILGAVFFGRISWKIIFTSLFTFAPGLPLVWRFMEDYQKERIMTFIQPSADPLGAGYNSIQAIIAIGSGGFLGRGLGQGTQSQLLFLPERHTDFIFSSIGEELGFLGAGLVVIFFIALFARLCAIFINADDVFSRAFLGGVFLMIFVQAAVNIGMNLGILPITGIPLPFVSSGGSSLLAMAITLGIATSFTSGLRTGTR